MVMMTGAIIRAEPMGRILLEASEASEALVASEALEGIRVGGPQGRMHRHSILMRRWIISATATIRRL